MWPSFVPCSPLWLSSPQVKDEEEKVADSTSEIERRSSVRSTFNVIRRRFLYVPGARKIAFGIAVLLLASTWALSAALHAGKGSEAVTSNVCQGSQLPATNSTARFDLSREQVTDAPPQVSVAVLPPPQLSRLSGVS